MAYSEIACQVAQENGGFIVQKMSKITSIHNTKYRTLIEQIVRMRKDAGINQQELAEILGVSQPDISKIERCERRLDVLEFFDILEIYSKRTEKPVIHLIEAFYDEIREH